MQVYKTVAEIRAARKLENDQSWGLVPTMGSLHEGHLSLIQRAKAENQCVGVSIFVNPKQFNNADDLENYPRNLELDLELLAGLEVDLVWTPDEQDVYPPGFQTHVNIERLGLPLEGGSRPGHFRGVCTVVTKLFNIFQPQRAYFGQKDAQQAVIVRRMAQDLNFDLDVVLCPTFREADGLALSSRNVRLNPDDRKIALSLNRALVMAQNMFAKGQNDTQRIISAMYDYIDGVPGTAIDYISINDMENLDPVIIAKPGDLVSLAVEIGGVRLIDNILLGE